MGLELARAAGVMADLTTVILEASIALQKVGALIRQAQSEQRDLSAADWQRLDEDLTAARGRLDQAIEAATKRRE